MTGFEHSVEVVTEDDIVSRVEELGKAITEDYAGRDPLFVVLMTGSIPFAADLVRSVDLRCEVDFLGLNRFGESGRIGIAMDLATPVLDREVILVEDITDTGLTLSVLQRMMLDRGAGSITTASLVDKMAKTFRETDGDIRAVLRTLFSSEEFWSPAAVNAKVKTPLEFVASAARATGAEVDDLPPGLVIALRALGPTFVSLYVVADPSLAILSGAQAIVFQAWITSGERRQSTDAVH